VGQVATATNKIYFLRLAKAALTLSGSCVTPGAAGAPVLVGARARGEAAGETPDVGCEEVVDVTARPRGDVEGDEEEAAAGAATAAASRGEPGCTLGRVGGDTGGSFTRGPDVVDACSS
jgi:hypothetical protein